MTLDQLLEALRLGESQDIEFKAAEGGLPRSLWETVSAFANTNGGTIVLGVVERDGGFAVEGVRKPDTLLKTFWDNHNNPQKLNQPVCREADVEVVPMDRHKLVCIHVPRAGRQQRPVFINGNPLTGTYKRNYEGDYRCTESEVRQMLRDAADEPLDGQILEGFDLDDLDEETLAAYRNRFASRDPDHPFLAMNPADFLENLGGLRRDRRSGAEGLTLAGLLMFGKERSLLDALPHFHLDYQEQLSSNPEERWTYRLTPDGKWVPNLFNFYYRVYPRLVEGIDVPFKLDKAATRLEETHVHEALREALVNTLIHADHQSSRPINVIKRPDTFIFMNPGRLRIPREQLYQGGVTDPRNPNLQKMFQMLGLGEKAGSGFQKILRAWREQHWMIPLVAENTELEMTRIWLPVASMIPDDVERELRAVVGDAYGTLDELGRVILMLAHRFGEVGNEDIQPYRQEHPREIGARLRELVGAGWLDKTGHGRGTRYRWPQTGGPDLFATEPRGSIGSEQTETGSEHLPVESEHLPIGSEHLPVESEHLNSEQDAQLLLLAADVRGKGKVPKPLMEATILALCERDWLSLRTLARLLNRESDSLRNHYINAMLLDGRLEARVPGKPNHPNQAYRKKGGA
ncbi:MAG: transcriptional regulator [Betaproteobacteria bacterium CG2_30_59_46]|nr:MAG: transcriptional regulator [Betaproteobacteria bacterium CG2_30_59_46]PIQ13660.1 MAG: transcriptional regulator [Hydrogenophilales bacterium CG18_big_fil_WC_8_21_14_2_50_58_12]PIY01179.1 MAG: transcriptional regulator [Hydrogenophilales bacterium CG_4_10_14_3_um_filter_58_23]PJB03549.1 MAG: transcriptional regulator [Hydrogenophilales bacterium CG_4_9_14_3_um_filter_59_35]